MRWPWRRRRKVEPNELPKQGNPESRRCGRCNDTRVERRVHDNDTYKFSIFYCPACDMIERKERKP